ncbi:MAG: hypothetical protein ACOYYU_16285 [Chloroflexota bacterium]
MKTIPTWILVEVRSGIPTSVRAFQDEMLAKGEEKKLRNTMNLDDDETAIFEAAVPVEDE